MKNIPIISVIIPVYNGSNFLSEAIESLLAQTDKRFEIVVINDGSNDNGLTRSIALEYNDYIHYYEKPNGGVASALNFGIQIMSGEYFSWLSHDDMFAPNRIEEDIKFLNLKEPAKVICCKSVTIDRGGKIIREREFPKSIYGVYDVMREAGLDMCCMTIHKSCFKKTGLFNEKNFTTQDTEMAVKLALNFRILYNSNTYSLRRDHDMRTTYTNKLQHQNDRDSFFKDLTQYRMEDFFPSRKAPNEEYKLLGDLFYSWGYYERADGYYQKIINTREFRIKLVQKFGSSFYYKLINNPISKSLISLAKSL